MRLPVRKSSLSVRSEQQSWLVAALQLAKTSAKGRPPQYNGSFTFLLSPNLSITYSHNTAIKRTQF